MATFSPSENAEILSTKTLIRQKFDAAVKDYPAPFIEFLLRRAVITGGISASIFNGEAVNDIDILLKDKSAIESFETAIKLKPLIDLVMDVNEKYSGTELVAGKMITSRAVTFKNKVQIITMHSFDARKTFDFIHTMPYLDLETNQYFISRQQFDSIKEKRLVRNPHPEAFIVVQSRLDKFQKRGWNIKYDEDRWK